MVVTVFKIVASALCAGGWVRIPPSPPNTPPTSAAPGLFSPLLDERNSPAKPYSVTTPPANSTSRYERSLPFSRNERDLRPTEMNALQGQTSQAFDAPPFRLRRTGGSLMASHVSWRMP